MKKRAFITLGLLIAVSAFGIAQKVQKIEIRVLDAASNTPVEGAVVCLANDTALCGEEGSVAVTNTEGMVSFEVSGNSIYRYLVRQYGYDDYMDTTRLDKYQYIALLQNRSTDLDEYVISSSRTARPLKLSPVVTQVISAKQLLDAGHSSMQQALTQETPGMNIQKVGFGNDISMQGLDARHILFLIDGERMTGEMAGNLDYERFNIHAIDRVEIVKGASSTLYGSRAAGAVVNLITKKTTKPYVITVGARYGQMNELNYRNKHPKDFLYMFEKNSDRPNLQAWLSAGFNKGKFTSQTDVLYSSSDGYYLYQKGADRKVYTAAANPFLKDDVEIISKSKRPPLGIEGSEYLSASQKIYYSPTNDMTIQLYGTAFFMNSYDLIQDLYFSQSKDMIGGAKISYRCYDYFTVKATLHSDFYKRFKRHERIDMRQQVYDSRIIQPRLTVQSKYFDRHDIILGFDYFQDDLTSDRFGGKELKTRGLKEFEFFVQDGYSVLEKLLVEIGVRTNFSKQFGVMALPKVAMKLSQSRELSYRINYAMGYRAPSIKELFFNWDNLGMFQIIGDENLQPEKNQYFSLGVEYAKPKFFIAANTFANLFYDKIEGVWRIYDFQYNFEYKNLSRQNLFGADAIMRLHPFDGLTVNGSYSYVFVSHNDAVKVNATSPHAATLGVEYVFTKKDYDLSVNFTTSIMGSKTFDVQDRLIIADVDTGKKVGRDAYFRCELPPYALCNLNITQQFYQRWKISVGANNIFNYMPKTLGSGITMFNIPATAGRRFFIQAELIF